MASKPGDLAGTERAAILLMSLGEQDAANLLKQLDAREVQRLGVAMAELKEVSREQMTSVLDNFIGVVDGKANIASGSQDYVRRVLTQAVGKQKTDLLLDRVSTGQTGQGIEALKWMDAKAVAQIISGEHPQIAAIVLSHLDAEQSAAILPLLTEEMRTEVLMRIATLNEVPQTALTELDQLVEKQANVAPPAPLRRIGGARTVANILNAMERDKSGEELGKIEKADTRDASADQGSAVHLRQSARRGRPRHPGAVARGRLRYAGRRAARRRARGAGEDPQEHVEARRGNSQGRHGGARSR